LALEFGKIKILTLVLKREFFFFALEAWKAGNVAAIIDLLKQLQLNS